MTPRRDREKCRMASVFGGIALLALGPGLLSCASTPPPGEAVAGPPAATLQRAIEVDVQCEVDVPLPEDARLPEGSRPPEDPRIPADGRYFGTREDWLRDVTRILAEMHVAEAVWSHDDPDRSPGGADMLVTVKVKARPPGDPDVETQSAVLDFFTWSTLPLLPWWIGDVDLDPGIVLEVQRSLPDWQESLAWPEPERFPLERRKTSLRERQPFVSWTTLGAVFVPPFVFDGVDDEHLQASIGAELREEAARRIAQIVQSQNPSAPNDVELLSKVQVEWREQDRGAAPKAAGQDRAPLALVLTFEPYTDLTELTVGVDGMPETDCISKRMLPGRKRPEDRILDVTELAMKASGGSAGADPSVALRGKLIRIVASGDSRENRPLRYSVRVPDAPPSGTDASVP